MRTGSSAEQNLKEMENQWAKASLAGDGDALRSMLSEDFVNLDSDGSVHNEAEPVAQTKSQI